MTLFFETQCKLNLTVITVTELLLLSLSLNT